MRQCNKCSNRKCDRIRMHRSKRRILSTAELQGSCPVARPPEVYKEKMLSTLLDSQPQQVHDILQAHGFILHERTGGRFRITLSEKGKQHARKRNNRRSHRGKRNVRVITKRV